MRAPNRILLSMAVSLAVSGGLVACGPGTVVRSEPVVRFVRPSGAVLYIRSGSGVMRLRFSNKKRLAPFTCAATDARVHTAESTTSLLYSLKLMSQKSGFSRVQLHDTDGKLLARGTFCIFPTLKTRTRSILRQYEIQLPPKVMKRLRSGKAVAVFEDYQPFERPKRGWNHLAWVLYLEHPSFQ